MQHVLDIISPGSFTNAALILLWIFTVLNILGIDLFASIQSIISFTMLVTLVVIGFAGLSTSHPQGTAPMQIMQDFIHSDRSVFSLILVALWPFLAFEMVCDSVEEAKNPVKHIPKAMLMGSVVMLFAYCLIAFTAMTQVPAEQLTGTDIPHWLLGKAIFGEAGKIIVLVLAITTTSGLISTCLAAAPRLLYGMAHHKQLPPIFMRLHPKWKTPWFGIIFISVLSTIPILLFGKRPDALLMLVISAATCFLMTYIIAHLDLIVLRKKYPGYPRPYKSPWFPLPQIIGIAGMIYAIKNTF
jgi:amino acid transporter